MAARLKETYINEVAPALMKKFEYKSVMQIPKLDKIVVNIACGEARENSKVLDSVVSDLMQITGQRPVMCRAKKSIANFKLREGMVIGAKVTLRGDRMYEFLDRFFNLALPRVRDFRGINPNSFDGRGNYSLGIKEQLIFPRSSTTRLTRSEAWIFALSRQLILMKRHASCSLSWALRSQNKEELRWPKHP